MREVFHLTADTPGVRLDRFVADNLPQLSRSRVQRLIDEGHITVNDRPARPGVKLNPGDRLTINIPPSRPSPLAGEDIPLRIIYEDDDVLVVDKPPGMTVHPAPGNPGHTLVNAVLHHFPHLADISDSLRPGIVHRLDRDTSGVMLIAKSAAAQADLAAQFRSRSVEKTYLVLVKGHVAPERGIIEAPVGRDPGDRQRMAVVSRGREARTGYRVIKPVGKYTLLEVKPETGRTHQIRVHLAAVGYPVVGDARYGTKSPHLSRQFLHASRLRIKLPSTGEYREFTAPLPADLEGALREIG